MDYILAVIAAEIEGLMWYFNTADVQMAISQTKGTSFVASFLFVFIAWRYIIDKKFSNTNHDNFEDSLFGRIFAFIGGCSGGIFYSHILVMYLLNAIISGWEHWFWMLRGLSTLAVSIILVLLIRCFPDNRLTRAFGC